MGLFKNIRGTFETLFQLGKDGPNLKNNSGVIEARNAADSDYVRMKAATPVDDADVVTKKWAETLPKPIVISRQADCSVSLPTNTGARGYVVVTTAGSGAAIGDLLFDDGSGSGSMEILAAVEGRTIATTDSLSGGAVTFDADSIYIWDADGSSWIKIGDIGSVTGALRVIRYTIDNTASQDSTSTLPNNCRVFRCDLEVTTPYSGGATITVGTTGTPAAFQGTSDNNPQEGSPPNTFSKEQDTAVTPASVVRTTIAGAPAAGAGVVSVWFTAPLN